MSKFDHTRGKPVGTVVFGDRQVRGASPRQAAFIDRLMEERVFDPEQVGAESGAMVNIRHASRVIEYLLSCPKKHFDRPAEEPPASPKAREWAQALILERVGGEQYAHLDLSGRFTVSKVIDNLRNAPKRPLDIEVGAYRLDGTVYSVRRTLESKVLYAVHWVEYADGWGQSERDYSIVYRIDPASRLSLKEAVEFAAQVGACVHCGRTLTDPKSILSGMGPVCSSKYN